MKECFCFNFFVSYLYQIAHLGDDDDEPEFSSAMELEEGTTFFFAPRGLKNLVLVDEIESLAPVMSCQVRTFYCSSRNLCYSLLFGQWIILRIGLHLPSNCTAFLGPISRSMGMRA